MSKNDATIQDKMKQLDELLVWFNGDDFVLEQASDKLKKAKSLADDIEASLDSLENEINIIKDSFVSSKE